jgi:hypothetical protein
MHLGAAIAVRPVAARHDACHQHPGAGAAAKMVPALDVSLALAEHLPHPVWRRVCRMLVRIVLGDEEFLAT